MDPNANLAEQIRIANRILDASEFDDDSILESGDVSRLAELVLSLDRWLRSHGPLPRAWQGQDDSEVMFPLPPCED